MDSAYNSPSLKRVGICICLCVYVIISRLSLTPNICLLDIWHPHRTSCYGTNRGMQQKQPKRKDARILLLLRCAVNVSQKWIWENFDNIRQLWLPPNSTPWNSHVFSSHCYFSFNRGEWRFILLSVWKGKQRKAQSPSFPSTSLLFHSFSFSAEISQSDIKVELGQNLNIKVVNENGNYLKKSHQHITGFECYQHLL